MCSDTLLLMIITGNNGGGLAGGSNWGIDGATDGEVD